MKLRVLNEELCVFLHDTEANGDSELVAEVHTSVEHAERIAASVNACSSLSVSDIKGANIGSCADLVSLQLLQDYEAMKRELNSAIAERDLALLNYRNMHKDALDSFAEKAMQGLLANSNWCNFDYSSTTAQYSYNYAEAMLAEKEKRKQKQK